MSPPKHRYKTAQEQLPAATQELLAELRRGEVASEVSSQVANAYLLALRDAGWTLRVLANGFNGVTIEAVRERILRASEPAAPAREGRAAASELEGGYSVEVAAAWRVWCSATSRPAERHRVPRLFAVEYQRMIDAPYDHDDMLLTVDAASFVTPAPRDPLDVRRVVRAVTSYSREREARALRDDPSVERSPFPAPPETRSRRSRLTPEEVAAALAELPAPPEAPARRGVPVTGPLTHSTYEIPEEVAEEIRGLQAMARLVKGSTPAGHPNRAASARLSRIMHEELVRGATFRTISEVAGVSWSAVKFRLGRYGYVSLPPSMKDSLVETPEEHAAPPAPARPSR